MSEQTPEINIGYGKLLGGLTLTDGTRIVIREQGDRWAKEVTWPAAQRDSKPEPFVAYHDKPYKS